jgi:YVTN family beta-propeller protein
VQTARTKSKKPLADGAGHRFRTLAPSDPVSPDGSKVYVANATSGTVSVIDTTTNSVTATVPVGALAEPVSVAVTSDGSKVYVANEAAYNVAVIDTATNSVAATISGFAQPIAFGAFIQPAPKFAGTPGFSNCHGVSISALSIQYGGDLRAAATALGFPNVRALQQAVVAFCAG